MSKKNEAVNLEVIVAKNLEKMKFKLYAAVDRGGYHINDLDALRPTDNELVQAARWTFTHDVSQEFKMLLKRFLKCKDMEMPLKIFRDNYLEMLLRFLWREWTSLGLAGQDNTPLRHVVDPEALLLFTCSLGRYDQRLFDEVMDWLLKNGRFLNIQRMRNILHQEKFTGGRVLGAVADWVSQRENPVKWRLLASM